MTSIKDAPQKTDETKISDDYFLKKENGKVSLFQKDGTNVFSFPVDSVDKIINFSSCLVYQDNNQIQMLCFQNSADKKTLIPDKQATLFRQGTLIPNDCYPFSPYFTLAIQESVSVNNQSGLSLYRTPQLIAKTVSSNWVMSEQSTQTKDNQEKTRLAYSNPWQFQDNQILYRTATKISLEGDIPQGRTETTLSGNTITTTLYNQDNVVVKSDQNITQNDDSTPSSADPDFSSPLSLTSTLQSLIGGFDIAQIEGAFFEDQEADFMSFESYETGRFDLNMPNHPLWQKKGGNIKKGWSLSGQQYLELAKGDQLKVSYQPGDFRKIFTVGIWVRSDDDFTTTSPLSVQFTPSNGPPLSVEGEIKNQFGNWVYIEAILSLADLPEEAKGGVITVQVCAQTTPLDIDNFRFSPLGSALKARVFDSNLRVPTGVFDSKGLYQRLVYAEHQLVANIRPNGTIQSLFYQTNPHVDYKIQGSLMPDLYGSDLTINPNTGFFEDADPTTIQSRWNLSLPNWQLAPGILTHTSNTLDSLSALLPDFFVAKQMGSFFVCTDFTNKTVLNLHFENYLLPISPSMWAVNLQPLALLTIRFNSRFFVFANGQLVIDKPQTPSSTASSTIFTIDVRGQASLKNLMLFDKPKVGFQYKNYRGQTLQSLVLSNENQILLSLCSYDSLGRQQKASLPLLVAADSQNHLLTYRSDIPNYPRQNFNYELSPLSEVDQIGFTQTEYEAFPSQILRGSYQYMQTKIPELMNQIGFSITEEFKTDLYRYVLIKDPDGIYSLSILNKDQQPVVSFLQTKTGFIQNQFSYQNGHLLRQQLPRQFVLGEGNVQQIGKTYFERSFEYTSDGQLHFTRDPDYGTDLMVYDPKSRALRFQVHYSKEEQFSYLLFFDYDTKGCVNFVGYHPLPPIQSNGKNIDLNDKIALESALEEMSPVDVVSDSTRQLISNMTIIHSSEVSQYSSLLEERGQIQSIYTGQFFDQDNHIEPIGGTEEFFEHDLFGSVTTKQRLVNGQFEEVDYTYDSQGALASIDYPTNLTETSTELVYQYDHLQRVVSIQSADNEITFAIYEYVGGSNLISIETLPFAKIVRQYKYNAANQLTDISDQCLEEELTYTSNAFQEKQTYKQVIASTSYSAPWMKAVTDTTALDQLKKRLYGIFPSNQGDVDIFVAKLITQGYLNNQGFLVKSIDLHRTFDFPVILDLSKALPLLQQQPSTNKVSHQYAYEFAGQLTKAKFLNELPNAVSRCPLLRFSATAILQYNSKPNIYPFKDVANRLYEALYKNFYVTEDGIWNLKIAEGLEDVLLKSNDKGALYLKAYPISLRNLLLSHYENGHSLTLTTFKGYYIIWTNISWTDPLINDKLDEAQDAWNWLNSNGFIDSKSFLVTDQFITLKLHNLLNDLSIQNLMQDVVSLIHYYQTFAIGESVNDTWVFGEDVHGNMSNYYVGDTRYQLSISNTSNQINSVLKNCDDLTAQERYLLTHDNNGNVKSASHLGIKTIQYDPYSNRPVFISMDERKIQFSYDSKGRRSLKRVDDLIGSWSEVRYLRNESGQVISEWHDNSEGESHIFSFIYGAMGLIAFVRDGNQFGVIKDHEGSIRAVMNDQQKVLYFTHYLPYGQKTHTYGDPDLLSYGYIGQEFDKETGLYNLNSRLYDPQLGRFYQVDPEKQYASPYIGSSIFFKLIRNAQVIDF